MTILGHSVNMFSAMLILDLKSGWTRDVPSDTMSIQLDDRARLHHTVRLTTLRTRPHHNLPLSEVAPDEVVYLAVGQMARAVETLREEDWCPDE